MINRPFSTMAKDEAGSMTIFGMFMIIACLVIGGLAMDVMNGVKTRTQLQAAADSAAHATLMARNYGKTDAEAINVGVAVGNAQLGRSGITDTLRADDFKFGKWDSTKQEFVIDSFSDDAILVSAQRLASRKNAVATGFLSMIGVNYFNVRSQSVFETYVPTCTREGFFAEGRVDVQSGNDFTKGFCIHSNTHVEMNIDNKYANNVIVSMPDETDVVIPSDKVDDNPGIEPALRDGVYAIPILYRIEEIINNIDNPLSTWFTGDYITIDPLTASPEVVTLKKNDKTVDVWKSGAVHRRTCTNKNGTITFEGHNVYTGGVLITNCKVNIGTQAQLIDIAIATTNTEADSVSGQADIVLGLDDDCAAGGGLQIATMGGVSFASKMNAYGAQILAIGDVTFTANANGVEGISIVAGGEIDSTSGIEMAFCNGAGMPSNWIAEYYRMAT